MTAYTIRDKHRIVPMAVNHVGPYFIDVVMVEHPTDTLPGRSNLVALNGRDGMLTNQEAIKKNAEDRVERLYAALEACSLLNDQEVTWLADYVKNNRRSL